MKTLKLTLLMVFTIIGLSMTAQSTEELQAQKAEKESQIATLQGQIDGLKGEVASIASQLIVFPYWETGTSGVLGLNFSKFSNWFTKANPNSAATNITGSFSGYANRFGEKYFWRNNANIGLGWQKLDTDTEVDEPGEQNDFEQTIDFLNIQSLYGYNLTSTLAVSALADYKTTLLSNFNDPGYLDIGTGVTWTPIKELVVVIHPLNYNIVFSSGDDVFTSSLGAKFVADYNREIVPGVKYRSNLSGFFSYKSADPNLHNYTWVNGLNFTAWKGIGVGIEFALRRNEQEAAAAGSENNNQNYFIVGLSYSL
jgi:hypothetical protein